MKKTFALLLALNLAGSPLELWAQSPPPPPNYNAPTGSQPILSPADLDTLVAPIALYPDPLVALILPASTVPTDIVLASRYLANNGDPNQIDAQHWDPSVKSLARYPDVINMMNENLDWTNQLGAAVIAQQPDVMTAIQAQRAKANALGNLKSTPQQTVIVEKQVIQVVPADPQVIYVPQYNPQVVYVEPAPVVAPLITFGIGFAMGAWISNGCNWNNNNIYVNNWGPGGWHGYNNNFYGGGGNNVTINNNNNTTINNNNSINTWKPNNNRPQPRPVYNPNNNRPGGNGSGTLPGFKPPPPGGWNGNGNNGGGNWNGNKPGNNGGGNWNGGNKPSTLPGNNGSGTWNGNKPGNNGGGTWNGGNKPSTLPGNNGSGTWNGNKPGNNGGGTWNGGNKPENKLPGSNGSGTWNGGNKPSTQPANNGGGQAKPKPSTPSRESFTKPSGNGYREPGTKQEPANRPAPQSRPAPSQSRPQQQSRPAPAQQSQGGQKKLGGGGGGGGGGNGGDRKRPGQ